MDIMFAVAIVFVAVFVWWYVISSDEEIKSELKEVQAKTEKVVEDWKSSIPPLAQLKKMTKPQLKELVEEIGVKIGTKKTKAFIIEDLDALREKLN